MYLMCCAVIIQSQETNKTLKFTDAEGWDRKIRLFVDILDERKHAHISSKRSNLTNLF